MKNILISFIRNNHLDAQKEGNFEDLDITEVVNNNSIDRLFLLTNKNRDESIGFKNWISEKLGIEVKAVTLEKGSEKYILNKIESIIKYILLAEEGHARFFYLPGENTLQINLWEIVKKNIYKGKIIYPADLLPGPEKAQAEETTVNKKKTEIPVINKDPRSSTSKYSGPPNKINEHKIFSVKAGAVNPKADSFNKGLKSLKTGSNLIICGEEGTGKKTLALKLLNEADLSFYQINFRTINPAKIDENFSEISNKITKKEFDVFLFLNVEVLPYHIQEQFTEYRDVQLISTMNMTEKSDIERLNQKFYYLLSASLIDLKPLRLRKDNIHLLVNEIIKSKNSNLIISDNALDYLRKHNWPGNLNELHSVLSRACIETGSVITAEIISDSIDKLENDLTQWQSSPIDENFKLNDILGDVAMHYIMLALEMSEGKKSKAAQMLGFSNYQTLGNWIKKYKK